MQDTTSSAATDAGDSTTAVDSRANASDPQSLHQQQQQQVPDHHHLCVIAWKLRTGFLGKFLYGRGRLLGLPETESYNNKAWEKRVIAVHGSSLEYYEIGEKHMNGQVRGRLDIVDHHVQVQVASVPTPDAPTSHEVDITFVPTTTTASSTAATAENNHPQPPEMTSNTTTTTTTNNKQQHWKFCFEQQADLMEFLKVVHQALEDHHQLQGPKDTMRFEHDFHAGDHIFRWEMIVCPPVIYPIQIHGIVLEAGRNCVVVADFGLTGYTRKQGEDFNHADANERHNNIILTAWRKLRPNQDQRLNIVALTDPREIRKWYRAHYEEGVFDTSKSHKNIEKISKFMGKLQAGTQQWKERRRQQRVLKNRERTNTADNNSPTTEPFHEPSEQELDVDEEEEVGGAGMVDSSAGSSAAAGGTNRVANLMSKLKLSLSNETTGDHNSDAAVPVTASNSSSSNSNNGDILEPRIVDPEETNIVPLQPELQQTATATSTSNENNEDQRKEQEDTTKQQKPKTFQKASEELPKSDPTEIVLARANYVLEHEDVLPPYHIFFSNSECIAVWCKTGRWSTLQTAVFLASNSVGGAKSSIVATIGVAAAHALLAPVVALGGAIYVCAPMVILKKSQEKWEQATQSMTDRFWQWAPPAIYVAAIEHWSRISSNTNTNNTITNTSSTVTTNAVGGEPTATTAEFDAVANDSADDNNDDQQNNDDDAAANSGCEELTTETDVTTK